MSKLFERLLKKRGVKADFLHPAYENLADPFTLPDMAPAIERILAARDKQEKILIYGDYDVDGVTASTVMEEALRLSGINDVEIMLPDRFSDGYGMSKRLIERATKDQINLVVTVDCGSANKEIIQELKVAGIDTIVTDHHECPAELPEAIAVINPKRSDYTGFRDLAGVGVAFKVAEALALKGAFKAGQEKWLLDLVLIGTICDNMPLLAENRILGHYGLLVLGKTRRKGLLELIKKAGVKKLNSETIGFQIGPRLNAAGRLDTANLALDLVRTKSSAEAANLANQLEILNQKRKTEQRLAVAEVEQRGINDQDHVIVEAGKWHEGILGIVAGRLTEAYKKPSFALTELENGLFKGSGRSFGDFNLAEALKNCSTAIISGGGHAGACGVKVANVADFKTAINTYYHSLHLQNQDQFLQQHADLDTSNLADFSLEFLEEVRQLEPFGAGNEEPIFHLTNVEIVEIRRMAEKHLRLDVKGQDGKIMKLVAFFAPENWFQLEPSEAVNIMIKLVENEWNGVRSVEGRIVDIKL